MPRLLKGRGGGGGEWGQQLKAKHVGPTILPKSSLADSTFLCQHCESGDVSDDAMSVSSVASSLGSLELNDSKADSKSTASKMKNGSLGSYGDRKRSRVVVGEDVPSSGCVHPPSSNGELVVETVARHTREGATSVVGVSTTDSPIIGAGGDDTAKTNAGGRWLCNVCRIVSFDSIDEAFSHERMCLAVRRNLSQRALQVDRGRQQALLCGQANCTAVTGAGMLRQLTRQGEQLSETKVAGVNAAALNAASSGASTAVADHFYVAELRRQQQIYQNALMVGLTPSTLSSPTIGASLLQPAPTLAPSITAYPSQNNVSPVFLLQRGPLFSTACTSTMETLLAASVGGVGPPIPLTCTDTVLPNILGATTVATSPQLQRPPENTPPPLHMPNRLALPEDVDHLNERECFLRSECLALFKATKEDSMSTRNGRKKPIWVGQVGIRCVFCIEVRATEKVPANTFEQTLGKGKQGRAHREACYPSSLKFIRKALDNWRENHFGSCPNIPKEVKEKYAGLARQGSCNAEQYRVEAALKVGLVDCPGGGVRFIRDQAPQSLGT